MHNSWFEICISIGIVGIVCRFFNQNRQYRWFHIGNISIVSVISERISDNISNLGITITKSSDI